MFRQTAVMPTASGAGAGRRRRVEGVLCARRRCCGKGRRLLGWGCRRRRWCGTRGGGFGGDEALEEAGAGTAGAAEARVGVWMAGGTPGAEAAPVFALAEQAEEAACGGDEEPAGAVGQLARAASGVEGAGRAGVPQPVTVSTGVASHGGTRGRRRGVAESRCLARAGPAAGGAPSRHRARTQTRAGRYRARLPAKPLAGGAGGRRGGRCRGCHSVTQKTSDCR